MVCFSGFQDHNKSWKDCSTTITKQSFHFRLSYIREGEFIKWQFPTGGWEHYRTCHTEPNIKTQGTYESSQSKYNQYLVEMAAWNRLWQGIDSNVIDFVSVLIIWLKVSTSVVVSNIADAILQSMSFIQNYPKLLSKLHFTQWQQK